MSFLKKAWNWWWEMTGRACETACAWAGKCDDANIALQNFSPNVEMITTQKRDNDWIAYLTDWQGQWECGSTEEEAIGKLYISIRAHLLNQSKPKIYGPTERPESAGAILRSAINAEEKGHCLSLSLEDK